MDKMTYFRFKRLHKNDPLYCADGYFSNREFIFKCDWIAEMKTRITMGLRRVMQRKQVETVTAKLVGNDISKAALARVIAAANESFDKGQYRQVKLQSDSIRKEFGFPHGRLQKAVVAFILTHGKIQVRVSPEYFTALFFDLNTTAYIKDETSPIIIKKAGEIVGLIAPMRKSDR